MGDLFWNKIAAVILGTLLVVMGLREISSIVFSVDAPEEIIYPVDLSALETTGGGEEEAPADIGLLLASADPSAGEQVARRCAACHTFDEGGADGTGPHLYGVVGRQVAGVSGFNYSSAMQEYGSGGTEWLYQNLFDYLASPRQYVPGTSMAFAGLRGEEDRANLIAYLAQQSPGAPEFPEPLPQEEPSEEGGGEGETVAAADGETDAEIAEADGSTDVSEQDAGEASEEEGSQNAAEDDGGLEDASEEAVEEAEAESGSAADEPAEGGDAEPAEDEDAPAGDEETDEG